MACSLNKTGFPFINPHTVGIIMKEACRRSMVKIRNAEEFTVQDKVDTTGTISPVTNVDTLAQAVAVRILRENFPLIGIEGEECFSVPCGMEHRDLYFLLDPMDGTAAFTMGQKHGIGSMISLVEDGEVLAAYIGDVHTRELYGFRPDSKGCYRVKIDSHVNQMEINASAPLDQQVLLLRKNATVGPFAQKIQKVFRSTETLNGSIGISTSKLWRSEAGAAVLPAKTYTPWDLAPIVGISQKLNCVFLREELGELYGYVPEIRRQGTILPETIVVHESRVEEIKKAYR